MKRVFIIHRWDGNPESDWYPWLKQELEKKGFQVFIPQMPNATKPEIEKWVSKIKNEVRNLDAETYFIGHSIGCQAIMRYVEKEKYNDKIGIVIFVAGWFKLDNLENEEVKKIANPWLKTPFNFNAIKQKISKLTVFLSTDDPYNFINENAQIFKNNLSAKIILEKNKGHFTKEDGIIALPEIVKEIN